MTGPSCIGIDGCPAGWVAATPDGVFLERQLSNLQCIVGIIPGSDIVAIDMPIGLARTGRRECDVLARQKLGPARRNSVFLTATRGAVQADSHTEATRLNRANNAKGVSAQAYHLFAKIREVDELLAVNPALQTTLYEVHPELAFACWNADANGALRPMHHPKKSGLGAYDRLRLVFKRYGRDHFERFRERHRPSHVADDDIADAYAALFSAERIAAGTHRTLPDLPGEDEHGLPMRICY